ncbi:hypothetical protein [Thermohalobacter berrensis]|uniref:Lipoprotein n=1 Tax=Thermohalobacter berrensis TaxID=99594 RepID=A0A419T4S2_9FIRM|nr:hypothetical protein [Thermohalobacter berrensis]RKD32452.1 hypothetical protein BET03_11100 [Thermohalobacter berrensis]
MKKLIIIIMSLSIIGLTGCYQSNNINKESSKAYKILSEEMEKYKEENKVKEISTYYYKDHSALMFRKENKLGIAQFFINDKYKVFKKDVQTILINNEDLLYFNFSNKTGSYIAVFITDPILQKKTEDIYVEFEKSDDKLKAIQESIVNKKGIVIKYSDGEKLRKINSISLMKDGKVIYSKRINKKI